MWTFPRACRWLQIICNRHMWCLIIRFFLMHQAVHIWLQDLPNHCCFNVAWPSTPIDGQCETTTPLSQSLCFQLCGYHDQTFYFTLVKVPQFTAWSFKDGCADFGMQADKKCPYEFRIYFFKQSVDAWPCDVIVVAHFDMNVILIFSDQYCIDLTVDLHG